MEITENNKHWTLSLVNFFKDFFLIFIYIFYYALIGVKACTFDFFVDSYNYLTWRFGEGYKRAKAAGNTTSYRDKKDEKKEKKYHYSARTLAKLDAEYQELLRDLQTSGATRSKEITTYFFKVRDGQGRIITGTMNGLSKLDINAFLVNEGYTVYSIKSGPLINFLYKESPIGNPKLKTKELIFWLTQLATYLKAGISLTDAVKILSKQTKNKSRKRMLQSLSFELTLGSSFSSALEKQGSTFPALLINMVKAAEASGTLVETLEEMADYYTEVDNTKKQMKSAMTYPAIISVFAIVVVTFILVFIIPRFVEIYEKNDLKLNGLTAFVIKASEFLKDNVFILFGVAIIALIFLVVAYKNIKQFRKSVQILLMHIPVVKNIIIYNELAIFTKTFASLLRNNVFITESIDILSKITNNEVYKEILYRTINNIVKGEKISEAFKDHWAVPEVAYFMIVTGESTGELDVMMQKVSDYYQGLHKSIINNLKAFIEPILISLLALIVGGIIIAVVVPMFGMYEQIM